MRLNRGFWSYGELTEKDRNGRYKNYPNLSGDYRYNPDGQSQLLGSLQPLGDSVKQVKKTFTAYRSFSDFWKDLVQPLVGIGEVISGAYWVVAPPFLYVGRAANKLRDSEARAPTLSQTASWMVQGALTIVTGALKVVTAPLTWFGRIPLRLAITAIKAGLTKAGFIDKAPVLFEHKASVQALVQDAETNTPETTANICIELHRRYWEKGHFKESSTNIACENEVVVFAPIKDIKNGVRQQPKKEECQAYLQLFSNPETNTGANNRNTRFPQRPNPGQQDEQRPWSDVTGHSTL